jgi:ubiquinone/menaquinone biosynthesis C-methylase UbiE
VIRLNLGCGPHIIEDAVNVDIVPLPGVDVVADLDQPWPWADGTVEHILASHLFEHVERPVHFMAEAWRVLTIDGVLDIRAPGGGYIAPGLWVPHQHGFTDPTHKRHCTPLTFDYWVPGKGLHDAYGPGFGSVKGGPRFAYEDMIMAGEQCEELRVILRKLGDDDGG